MKTRSRLLWTCCSIQTSFPSDPALLSQIHLTITWPKNFGAANFEYNSLVPDQHRWKQTQKIAEKQGLQEMKQENYRDVGLRANILQISSQLCFFRVSLLLKPYSTEKRLLKLPYRFRGQKCSHAKKDQVGFADINQDTIRLTRVAVMSKSNTWKH